MPADRARLEQVAALLTPPGSTCVHLGTGGFASTFKIQTSDGDTYALKIVDAQQSAAERTNRELTALQRVSHPNVVGYQGTGVENFAGTEYRWLKMAFVEGETIAQLMGRHHRFDLGTAVDLMRQAVAGASALWAEQTAHRDLSPNNLLLTPAGQLVIVDLGMARALDDDTITTLPTPGTPGWMSPEQVGASPTHGDWRSDQFVLGLISYWLITGAFPFVYRNAYEAWRAPDQQRPRSPRELDTAIPGVLADVVMKMLAKQPHRRYLQAATLAADLDRVAASLSVPETALQVIPRFILCIGDKKSFAATPAFLPLLGPDALMIEPRARDRVGEFMDLTRATSIERLVDPCTHFSRSPLDHRPAFFRALPYGETPVITGFSSSADRDRYCTSVLDYVLASEPDVIMAPYFYAGGGETVWIEESLRCAQATMELLTDQASRRGGVVEPVWTTVAVAQSWLTQEESRDRLLTLLTSQPIQCLNLLIHTTQQTFAPLADRNVLAGVVELLTTMREAGTPVTLGRRSTEGLLCLALGAAGWSTGVSGVQMNMAPHPEAKETGGPGYDRIYVPKLLTHVTTQTYVQFAAVEPDVVRLETAEGVSLLNSNTRLEPITTQERLLLLRHNVTAMRSQVTDLAVTGSAERINLMRRWVREAKDAFGALPIPGGPGESSAFLDAWAAILA